MNLDEFRIPDKLGRFNHALAIATSNIGQMSSEIAQSFGWYSGRGENWAEEAWALHFSICALTCVHVMYGWNILCTQWLISVIRL